MHIDSGTKMTKSCAIFCHTTNHLLSAVIFADACLPLPKVISASAAACHYPHDAPESLCSSRSSTVRPVYPIRPLSGVLSLSPRSVGLCEASGRAAMSWSILTSGIMISPSMWTRLAMPRTGSVSAPLFTPAGCASSMPVSGTPAVTEPHASRSLRWKPCVSAPTEDKVYCVGNVSVTKNSFAQIVVKI